MSPDNDIQYIDKEGNIASKIRKPKKEEKEFDYSRYMNLGFYLVTPLLVGIFIGYEADKFFKTKPLFVIIGIVIGAISSLYNLVKTTQDASH